VNLFGRPAPAPQVGSPNGNTNGTGTGNEVGADAATPVDTRLGRLAAVVERARRKGGGPNMRRWLELIGMAMIVFGFVCILLGWYGAAHSAYQYQEIPYLISGGLLGVALVIAGGILLRTAWSMRQLEEDRRNALAIVRSVDRLERVLKTMDDKRRAEAEEAERERNRERIL
jgi:hypothetical protein